VFDVGFTEILLIGIVSLVVIGPERLPAVAKTAGHWIGKLQRFVTGVKTDLASELEHGDLKKLIGDQREQIDELRNMVSTATKDLKSTTQSVVKTTQEGLSDLQTTVNEAKSEITSDDKSSGSAANSVATEDPGAIAVTDGKADVKTPPSGEASGTGVSKDTASQNTSTGESGSDAS